MADVPPDAKEICRGSKRCAPSKPRLSVTAVEIAKIVFAALALEFDGCFLERLVIPFKCHFVDC